MQWSLDIVLICISGEGTKNMGNSRDFTIDRLMSHPVSVDDSDLLSTNESPQIINCILGKKERQHY